MTVCLRPAVLTDAGAVGGILSDAILAANWMPRLHSRAQDIGFADVMISRGWVTVAVDDRKVVGFLAQQDHRLQALYLSQLACGHGIGARLLQDAKGRGDHLEAWVFQANIGAQRFYQRHGFVETCRSEGQGNDEGLPDICYQWHRLPQDQKDCMQ